MTDPLSVLDTRQSGVSTQFNQYVSYEDDGATVICDRSNAAAWIRSADIRPCKR